MPFRASFKSHIILILIERRRIRVIHTEKTPPQNVCYIKSGRASVSASVTVEAAMAVPIFFLAVVGLICLLELMAVETAVRAGLQYAGKQAAEEAAVAPILRPSRLEEDVVKSIGAQRLNRSLIEGGSSGIHCDRSYISPRTGIGQITAVYQVRIPIPLFSVPLIQYEETMRIKGWTGYEKGGFGGESEETVYVTETGLVYHKDYHCTHLDLSIRTADGEEIQKLRNESGGKYYPCEYCRGVSGGVVYITDTGNRYHSSLSCSGLKRTVYAVPLSEIVGKGACSRCGH